MPLRSLHGPQEDSDTSRIGSDCAQAEENELLERSDKDITAHSTRLRRSRSKGKRRTLLRLETGLASDLDRTVFTCIPPLRFEDNCNRGWEILFAYPRRWLSDWIVLIPPFIVMVSYRNV